MHTSPAAAPTPSWTVGGVTVLRIDEVALPPATGPWLLPDATPEVVTAQDWLRPTSPARTGFCTSTATASRSS